MAKEDNEKLPLLPPMKNIMLQGNAFQFEKWRSLVSTSDGKSHDIMYKEIEVYINDMITKPR